MKFFRPFTLQGFLFGVGIAVVTSALAPIIKENSRNLAVKGTEGMIMAGDKINNVKENMSDKVSNLGNKGNDVEDNKADMLYEELKKERKELKNLVSEINDIKKNMKKENNEL